jgi:uncharacterized OB-fold protein
MSYTKPLPRLDTVNRPFWTATADGKFMLQFCKNCGATRYPPGPICPKCLSSNQDWKPASGRGTLESWVDFHRAYWDGFKGDLPYRVCLVRLEEGPVVVSNLIDKTDNLRMGQPVKVVFEKVTDEVTLPKFTVI